MAQRFSGSVPNPGPSGPPPQRYAPPQSTGMRQYPGQNFPQRSGFTPPPNMGTSGGTMMQRPQQQQYSPMRGGPIQPQTGVKRPADNRGSMQQQKNDYSHGTSKKKKKLADKILPQKVRDLVPESQAYMDLLAFERKLDATIMRKRLDIQEALKRPMKQKRKLRIFISNTFYPSKEPQADGPEGPGQEGTVASWELRVEGRLLEESKNDPNKVKLYDVLHEPMLLYRSSFYSFQVKRPGDKNVRCTILLLLDYQPLQFKLDPRLARLLGVHTQTRPVIISALWQYIKTHR
ncbi:swi/snf-related matrix-associated actin-dependent regulator of chromatin subfamily d [Holotrichia oblita]|uniref:Swi/snf-related matrix-associated actin-dependent regulator of chromatin subfamily d n=1 Tax=Holotrichia oblita TaxID=644536 RepID=A0ACB9T3T3_HOLOL|nr:swi/snf-related matrix-associated actin-dependent regulator of chromatin subfamily d [Holotrichia oblita]